MIEIKHFSVDQVADVQGHIFLLNKSCLVWIGSGALPASFSNLVVAMPTKFDSLPLSTSLLSEGEGEDEDYSAALSQRISRIFNIQCFVSCCASSQVEVSVHEVEKLIIDELRPHFS